METMGAWVSLLDFAQHNRLDLRTLRLQVSRGHIPYRMEQGKCRIWDQQGPYVSRRVSSDLSVNAFTTVPSFMDYLGRERRHEIPKTHTPNTEESLLKAQREIAELKTLLAFYEDKARKEPTTAQASYIRAFLEPEL